MDIDIIDHVALTTRDLATSLAWYQKIFGFIVLHRWTTTWMITSGRIKIGLFLRPNAASIDDIDNKIAIQHFAFLMTSEGLSAAQQFLKQSGIAFDGPEDTGIADSIFLSDPDGHQVELTAYHVPSPAVSETNLVKDCIASRNLASS